MVVLTLGGWGYCLTAQAYVTIILDCCEICALYHIALEKYKDRETLINRY